MTKTNAAPPSLTAPARRPDALHRESTGPIAEARTVDVQAPALPGHEPEDAASVDGYEANRRSAAEGAAAHVQDVGRNTHDNDGVAALQGQAASGASESLTALTEEAPSWQALARGGAGRVAPGRALPPEIHDMVLGHLRDGDLRRYALTGRDAHGPAAASLVARESTLRAELAQLKEQLSAGPGPEFGPALHRAAEIGGREASRMLVEVYDASRMFDDESMQSMDSHDDIALTFAQVASPDHVDGLRALLDDNMEHLRAMAANALARFEPSVRGAADVHALALRAATDLSASVFDKIHWLSPDEREAAHREVHARYAPVVRDLEAMPSGPGLDEMAVEMLHNLPPDVRNCLPPPSFIAALVARGQFPENRQLRGEVQNIFRTLLQNADSPPSRKVTAADVAMLKESMRVMWRRPDDWGSTLQLVEGILRKLEPPTFTGA